MGRGEGKNLRNVVKRRTHLERHQLKSREKLGMLEKKKDYVVRARDFHKKKDHLALLQEKARIKNPDEFYHKMISTKLENGKIVKNKQHKKKGQEHIEALKDKEEKPQT